MNVIINKLTNFLAETEMESETQRMIMRYGIASMIGNITSIIITIIMGILFEDIICSVLVWFFMFLLRKNAGGFHAKTVSGCLITSVGMLFIFFLIFSKIMPINSYINISIIILMMIIVFAFAPVDNYQKRLDETEFEMYRKRSVIIGSIEAVIGMTAMLLKCDILVRAILISLSYVGASLIVGYILNTKKHI